MGATMEEVHSAALNVFRSEQARAFLSVKNPKLGKGAEEDGRGGQGNVVLKFLEKLAEVAPPAARSLDSLFRRRLGPFAVSGKR
jgi:hypothetical protein